MAKRSEWEVGMKHQQRMWTGAKGRTLLDKITIETGLVFDKVNYQLIEPGQKEETDGIDLGLFFH